MDEKLIFIVIIILILGYCSWKWCGKDSGESFNIPLRESSAWGWNTGPGYGAGYGTGYSMWGKWPANMPNIPWRNWMWGRRPLVFVTPFTPVPQIDYSKR